MLKITGHHLNGAKLIAQTHGRTLTLLSECRPSLVSLLDLRIATFVGLLWNFELLESTSLISLYIPVGFQSTSSAFMNTIAPKFVKPA